MAHPHNPFLDRPKARAGHGAIHIANLARQDSLPQPALQTLEYQYPLKLVSPTPLPVTAGIPDVAYTDDASLAKHRHDLLVYTVFLLSYGGGLVAGDAINLTIRLDLGTRLNLLTQGSTKIFKTRPGQPSANSQTSSVTTQSLTTHLFPHSALVLLPDPVQPFAHSRFTQHQTYVLADQTCNLCVLDWVTSGRSARGENWDCAWYESRNEVYAASHSQSGGQGGIKDGVASSGKDGEKGRLLLRDNIRLDSTSVGMEGVSIRDRVHHWGVVGTVIITGPLFTRLSTFFTTEFSLLPRIGAPRSILLQQSYDDEGIADTEQSDAEKARKQWRERRWDWEKKEGLLWTSSTVRAVFTVVKFSAPSVEVGRQWLYDMLRTEGSVEEAVGERGLLCLR